MPADLKGSSELGVSREGVNGPTLEPGVGSLVGGIVADIQALVQNHLDLFLEEIRKDFAKTKEAALPYFAGVSLAALSLALFMAMLVGLLAWAVPSVPWWGWCGILSGAGTLIAAILYYRGKRKFESFNPLPDESAQALLESVARITQPGKVAKN